MAHDDRITRRDEAAGVALDALAGAPVGWWRVRDPQTAWWSASMFALFGIDPARGVPTPDEIFELYHPDDTNMMGRNWRHLFASDEASEMRYRIRRPDGVERHLWSWAQRRPPDADGDRWIVGLTVDITDQVKDQDLFESERAFRFVAENTQDMVLRSRLDGGITYVSPSSRAVLGYAPSEMIGRSPGAFLEADEIGRLTKLLGDRVRRGEQTSKAGLEYRAIHKDGSRVWLEGNPRLVLNGAGRLTEMVDVVRNITARKEAEAALAEALREAEAAAAAKSEFLANMSHELRTPLTSILGFSHLIAADESLSASARHHIELVSRAGETLLAVVNDILEFSKLEAGSVELEHRSFAVRDAVGGVVELLQGQAAAKGLELTWSMAGEAVVKGDETRLNQVLLNLIGNAIKFTDAGAVQVRVMTRTGETDRTGLRVEVHDTGIGLTPRVIERLFDRFTQADSSVSRRFGGTGLGLAISRRIVELMGGRIGADSDGMTGSCFWFDLELETAAGEASTPAIASPAAPVDRLRVLLAEDNPANRILVAALLAPFEIDLVTVENGAEAVAACAHGTFDLILMDMQMPVMDGVSAARAIRAAPGPERDIPIVALTANVMPEQVDACRRAGMQGHLAKPIDPAALIQTLREFGRRPESPALSARPVSRRAGAGKPS